MLLVKFLICFSKLRVRNSKLKLRMSSNYISENEGLYDVYHYVTDVEGNWDYWNRYLRISRALDYNNDDYSNISLKDNCQLIFGGDVCDRGPGDLRITEALTKLKEKYPTRVHFILGNRDVNKLRLPLELDNRMLSQKPEV